MPETLVRAFRLEALDGQGQWQAVFETAGNHQRLVKVPLDVETRALRLVPLSTWGAPTARLFAFDVR